MAGFCVRVSGGTGAARADRLLPVVSLGAGEAVEQHSVGGIAAVWSRWPRSRQLWLDRTPSRLSWIEGQPDRIPAPGETLQHWISGRWGSFRAFELDGATSSATIFVDPLGTRPVFYCRVNDDHVISDKLATLVAAAAPKGLAINWGALLESVFGGILVSPETTLLGASQLAPGAVLRVDANGAVVTGITPFPARDDLPEALERRTPVDHGASLLDALRTSVRDVWTDREAALLLSGGLDSRLVLGVAGPGRKAICVTSQENLESAVARHIATRLKASFTHVVRPSDQYLRALEYGDLICGGMYHFNSAHFVGLASEWREAGVGGLCHAYLFDILFKAWHTVRVDAPEEAMTYPATPEERGRRVLSRLARQTDLRQPETIRSLLTDDGLACLDERFRMVGEQFPRRPAEVGVDRTLDEWVVSRAGRHIHYPLFLSCIEEQDVQSVIFHPAPWRWRMSTPFSARYQSRSHLRAVRLAEHGLAWTVDANYNEPPVVRQLGFLPLGRDLWRPLGIRAWRAAERLGMVPRFSPLTHPEQDPSQGAWPPMDMLFRHGNGATLLGDAFDEIARGPMFKTGACEELLSSFLSGDDTVTTTVLALAGAGRWIQRVRALGAGQLGWWVKLGSPEGVPVPAPENSSGGGPGDNGP